MLKIPSYRPLATGTAQVPHKNANSISPTALLQAGIERRPAPAVYRPAPPMTMQPKAPSAPLPGITLSNRPPGPPPFLSASRPTQPFPTTKSILQRKAVVPVPKMPTVQMPRSSVIQRQVTETEIDNFLKGKKLVAFADQGRVWEEIGKTKYTSGKQQHMPNFDAEDYQDVKALQQRAKTLLDNNQQGQRATGLPPFLAPEIYSAQHYFQQKREKQQNKTHINVSKMEIEERLIAIRDSTDAGDVSVHLYIDNTVQNLPQQTPNANPFEHPFEQTNEEITNSAHDAEVQLLAKALAACRTHHQTHGQDQQQHTYELALVGPHGACDGCKDRLRAFKTQWRNLVRNAVGPRSLVITYFYTTAPALYRTPKSLYGWHEGQDARMEYQIKKQPKQKSKKGGTGHFTYYYRSMNAAK
jgi:hypothetical protein